MYVSKRNGIYTYYCVNINTNANMHLGTAPVEIGASPSVFVERQKTSVLYAWDRWEKDSWKAPGIVQEGGQNLGNGLESSPERGNLIF